MPTPRTLYLPERHPHRYVICLPSGKCWTLDEDWGLPKPREEPWDPSPAEETTWEVLASDLTDEEIQSLDKPEGRPERMAALLEARKALNCGNPDAASPSASTPSTPRDRTWALTVPDADGDRALTGPDGSWRWLYSDSNGGVDSTSPIWPPSIGHDDLAIVLHLTEEEAFSLLPAKGRNARIEQIRASRATEKILEKWAPTCSPAFAESLRAQGLGAREPIWEEPEDLVREPPHYRLPGDRETLEDVIAPICDALSERRLPGSAVYMVGNALKYLSRLGAKGPALEDLRKAREYLDRAIARMEAEK